MTQSELKGEKLQPSNGPTWDEGYLLDVDSGESMTMLDNDWLQSLGSRSNFQPDTPVDVFQRKSESLVFGSQLHGFPTQHHMNGTDSSEIFYCTIDADLSLDDQWLKYPTPFSVENIDQLEDVSSMFCEKDDKDTISSPVACPSVSKQENGHGSVSEKSNGECHVGKTIAIRTTNQSDNLGTHAEKRPRKPPRRYIDEMPEPISKVTRKKGDISVMKSSKKILPVKHHKHLDLKSRVQDSSPEEQSGMAIQVPFAPVVCCKTENKQVPVATKVKIESRPRAVSTSKIKSNQAAPCSSNLKINHVLEPSSEEQVLCSNSDRHSSATTSEDDCVEPPKSGERRKHHILWTMSEVRKLIDGVSEHGVGKWSRIKKDLFPSSPHRTPVDLKDKWRNLLKAAYIQRESKNGNDKKRNLAWRPLPKSILRRVSELAITYPYPRALRSKHS